MYPTSGQYLLSAGDYDAAVTQVGAALPSLRYAGRDPACGFSVGTHSDRNWH